MSNQTIKPVRISLKELVDHYEGFMVECERKSGQTRGTYQRALREFLKWFPVDKRFRFRVRDVERYKKHLVERKQLKNVSVGTYMTALRRFCQYLIDIGVLADNPASHVVGGRRPVKHTREVLTSSEIKRLLSSVERKTVQGLRDYAVILSMLRCALSEQECLHADIGDIAPDVERGMIIRVQGKGRTAKDEVVVLPDEVYDAIQEYLRKRFTGDDVPDEAVPLFASLSNRTKGKRMTARGIREAVNRWLKESGVKGNRDRRLTPFSLRHTAGLIMVDNGATVEDIMRRMRIEWRPTAQLYLKMRSTIGNASSEEKA